MLPRLTLSVSVLITNICKKLDCSGSVAFGLDMIGVPGPRKTKPPLVTILELVESPSSVTICKVGFKNAASDKVL